MNLDLLLTTLARLSVNLVFRLPYPLLPTISRGLGVPVAFLSMLLAIRSAFAIATPAFSWLPNRLGRRQTVLFLFSITALALGWLAIQPSLLTFCVALAVAMLTKIVFDPLVVTFLSERTPYERRGLVLGLAEFAWAGAALLGLPLCAWWVERQQHWAAAFAPLAVFLLLAGLLGASRFFHPRRQRGGCQFGRSTQAVPVAHPDASPSVG
jgi:DHA1 family inner membrane transport protein